MRAPHVALDVGAVPLREVLDHGFDLGALVPEIEHAPRRVLRNPSAIGAGCVGDDRVALGRRESPLPRCDVHARAEALHVPLPRAGHGLVEVVDVEHQVAFGAGEQPEVVDVRVATGLHADPGDRGGREVGRHDRCRAPEERERRLGHPLVANRPELGHPCLGLSFEDVDGIASRRRSRPLTVRRTRNIGAPSAARFSPCCW